LGTYYVAVLLAPVLFACGLLLYYADPALGEPIQVDKDGVVGVAANISVTGLGAVMRFMLAVGPYVLVMLGLALPIVAALFVADLFDTKRFSRKRLKRTLVWVGASAETIALLTLFIFVLEQWPA